MDKLIVRASVLIINIYIPIVTYFAYLGIDISVYDFLFSSSFMMGLLLTILCHSQGKYHCKWIRGLCYNAMILPMMNFIDIRIGLFENAYTYIYVTCFLWSSAVYYTIFLAIDHFRRVRRVKRLRYGKL